jgi:uncharacterized protein YjdB
MITAHVDVTDIAVSPTSLFLAPGGSGQVSVTISPTDATNKAFTWTSNNPDVVSGSGSTISASTSATAGDTATLTATTAEGGYSATVSVTITADGEEPVPVTGIEVNPTSLSVAQGGSGTVTVTVLPSNATNKAFTWTSNNPDVVSGSGNTIRADSSATAGETAILTATTTDGNFTADVNVTITARGGGSEVPVDSITVDPPSLTLVPGAETSVSATVLPANASNKDVAWSSDNPDVTVDSSTGAVSVSTSAGNTTATITATAADGSGVTGICEVTVTAGGKGIVVNFTGFGDEKISFAVTEPSSGALSMSNLLDNLQVTVSPPESGSYSSYQWYMDGSLWRDGVSSVSIVPYMMSSIVNIGIHTLSVVLTKDNVPYSKELTFRVVE